MPYRMRNGGAICEWDAMRDLLSTDAYVEVATWSVAYFKTKIFTFSAVTNNLLVQVLGSRDGGASFPTTVEDNISVTTATPVVKTYADMYTHLKVNVKAAGAGNQGTLSTKYFGTWV